MKMNSAERSKTLRRVLQYTGHARKYIVFSILLALISVALTLYLPVLTGNAIDLILGAGQVNMDGLLVILTRMAIIILLTALAQWGMAECNNRITFRTVRDIREDAFAHLQRLQIRLVELLRVGEQRLVAVRAHVGDDVRNDGFHACLRLCSGKYLLRGDFPDLHDPNHPFSPVSRAPRRCCRWRRI